VLSLVERRIRWLTGALWKRPRAANGTERYRSWFAPNHRTVAELTSGLRYEVRFCEDLATPLVIFGGWEDREIARLCSAACTGSVAIDVGANLGLFTIPLARAVGSSGRVMAFEPLPSNVELLASNIALNGLSNVQVFPLALSDSEGEIALHLSYDLANPSIGIPYRANGQTITVQGSRLDRVWAAAGRPKVSVLKIDVEGAELAVLRGAGDLLHASLPTMLIEAHSSRELHALVEWLSPFGYQCSHPAGFSRRNHLFTANSA
jgi:FkbM family methyltransferase